MTPETLKLGLDLHGTEEHCKRVADLINDQELTIKKLNEQIIDLKIERATLKMRLNLK